MYVNACECMASGVKQGCNMSGFLFLIIIEWVTRRTDGNGENGIRWRFTSKLDDLDFADDIALISSTKQQIQNKTTKLEEEARRVGLKVSTEKTKTMRINARNEDKIVVNEIDIEDVDEFAYLGAKVCKGRRWYKRPEEQTIQSIHQTEEHVAFQ